MLNTITTPHISIAPMLDCTDRHDRYFLRLIAPDIKLYTEMITTQAIMHGDAKRFLAFHPAEKYIALQLGGSNPQALAHCAALAETMGYDEINLNVGCPSARVKSGQFGACLMLKPQLVADCMAAMQAKVSVPVTLKCRIGVDEEDSYESLFNFIKRIAETGCQTFIIHARKAWLNGLSPKQNRTIPPLRYDIVKQIKKDFPALTIILNGGITTLKDITTHLPDVDGVMIGRAAYANPYLLAEIEAHYFPERKILSRLDVIEKLIPYIRDETHNQVRLSSITRHILGLFQGQRGAANWRRYLSEHAHKPGANVEVVKQALALVINQS